MYIYIDIDIRSCICLCVFVIVSSYLNLGAYFYLQNRHISMHEKSSMRVCICINIYTYSFRYTCIHTTLRSQVPSKMNWGLVPDRKCRKTMKDRQGHMSSGLNSLQRICMGSYWRRATGFHARSFDHGPYIRGRLSSASSARAREPTYLSATANRPKSQLVPGGHAGAQVQVIHL